MNKRLKFFVVVAVVGLRLAMLGCEEGFVKINPGTYKMGSSHARIVPVHNVTISKAYYMCDHEVTQKEYESLWHYTGNNAPGSSAGIGKNYPVYYVSWYDAIAYCNMLSISKGLTPCYSINGTTNPDKWGLIKSENDVNVNEVICNWDANGYRLPTEAEWEYAARSGEASIASEIYSGTDDEYELKDYAWYGSNADYKTHEEKTKLPNAWGLYDMSGNVWEWCWDWWPSNGKNRTEDETDPTGEITGTKRVIRGGSCTSSADYCTLYFRDCRKPYLFEYNIGFRVCRTCFD